MVLPNLFYNNFAQWQFIYFFFIFSVSNNKYDFMFYVPGIIIILYIM
jgi:hypothetical protein